MIAERLLTKHLKSKEKKLKSFNTILILVKLFIQSKKNINGPMLNLFYSLQMKNRLNGLVQNLKMMEKEKK